MNMIDNHKDYNVNISNVKIYSQVNTLKILNTTYNIFDQYKSTYQNDFDIFGEKFK